MDPRPKPMKLKIMGKIFMIIDLSMISWTQNQKHKEQKQRQTDEITSI